jgi:peptidoglycan-associated lipoprotein
MAIHSIALVLTSHQTLLTQTQCYEGAKTMKLNKIDFLEHFLLVSFPLALVVGCTTTAERASQVNLEDDVEMTQEYPFVRTNDQQTLEKLSVGKTNDVLIHANVSASEEIDNNHDNSNQGDDMPVKTAVTEISSQTDLNIETVAETDDAANDKSFATDLEASTTNDEHVIEVNIPLPVPLTTSIPKQGIIFFEVNTHEVSKSDVEVLKQHASYLKQNPNLVLYVDGFSDSRGPASLNYQLSKKRAQQVAKLLFGFGAPESRIKVNGYGESFPLTRESDWDENRRVELEYANIITSDELYADLK